ncbi:MAG: hypothetical protein L0K73_08300 [Corynebacterium variabile]|uniref:AfsA-related hotdog domain-containing protein n=1 Tax=Corynebacterium variabile TaxID=1727 RepID=UPI002648457B|nr:AfsA-related hotdog domain-containing protein [Corynebacterium variabile]MDN6536790.1 hypothetical protein [Corynebacterium variabile]
MPLATHQECLSFDRGISRDIVHRASIAEVFLTDTEAAEDGVVFAAQLPRNHSYFSDHRGACTTYDPLLIVEVFRQVAIGYAHIYQGVDRSQKFVFKSADFTVVSNEALTIGSCPGHCTITARVVDEKLHDSQVTGLTLDMAAYIDGVVAATETMVYQWLPSDVWDRIRSRSRSALNLPDTPSLPQHRAATRMLASAVGRHTPRNAILANPAHHGDSISALTLIDVDHPSLFDHELDHVPGMLQFEAARQISMAAANVILGLDTSRLVMDGLTISFDSFGELEIDTVAHATAVADPDNDGTVIATLTLTQGEIVIASGRVHLAMIPASVRTLIQ